MIRAYGGSRNRRRSCRARENLTELIAFSSCDAQGVARGFPDLRLIGVQLPPHHDGVDDIPGLSEPAPVTTAFSHLHRAFEIAGLDRGSPAPLDGPRHPAPIQRWLLAALTTAAVSGGRCPLHHLDLSPVYGIFHLSASPSDNIDNLGRISASTPPVETKPARCAYAPRRDHLIMNAMYGQASILMHIVV